MSRKVIALSGWKQSGKDTVANYLVKEYGFVQLSFAAKLKDMVAQTYGVLREDLDSPTKKEMPLVNLPTIPTDPFTITIHSLLSNELRHGFWTPRALCILEGSIKRSVYPNYWVRSCAEQIINNPTTSYVISDMRYKSEADTLRTLIPSIEMIRIERYANVDTTDPSERDLDDYALFDRILTNKKLIEDLYISVDHYLFRGTI